MITSKQLEKEYYAAYQDLRNTGWIFPKDTRYKLPTHDELNNAVKESSVKDLKWPDGSDCDDRALQLMARVRFNRPFWPFGECSGLLADSDMFGPGFIPHDRCTCLTTEGIRVIEPEDDSISKPHENFRIYWVRV